jgi:hypothetical protein
VVIEHNLELNLLIGLKFGPFFEPIKKLEIAALNLYVKRDVRSGNEQTIVLDPGDVAQLFEFRTPTTRFI